MEIDLVYTWVDGEDPDFQKLKSNYRPDCNHSNKKYRWISHDFLKYSLRSIHQHAAWIRKIHLVTNGQVPTWLKPNDKLNLVLHEDIFADKNDLPTFNSFAIETNIHRIPGLAEQFIYANDDCFLGQPLNPEDCFTTTGRIKCANICVVYENSYESYYGDATMTAVINAANTLIKSFPNMSLYHPIHQMNPYTKSLYQLAESMWPDEFRVTSSSKFREHDNVALNPMALVNLAIQMRMGVWCQRQNACYNIGSSEELTKLLDYQPAFYCFHDMGVCVENLGEILHTLCPNPSPYEW